MFLLVAWRVFRDLLLALLAAALLEAGKPHDMPYIQIAAIVLLILVAVGIFDILKRYRHD